MKELTKINLGCGPLPLTKQDLHYMDNNLRGWILADLFPENEGVQKIDMQDLSQFPDNHFTHMYSSHSLEHILHSNVKPVLKHWYEKLAPEGKLTINVPDIMWALKRIEEYENYQVPSAYEYYYDFFGPHGLVNVLYGSEEQPGEFHFVGFTKRALNEALEEAGFEDIRIEQIHDAHSMGVLIAICQKQKS